MTGDPAEGGFDRSSGRDLYGQDPAAYDAGRPRYPERVYEVLRHGCGLGDGSRVLEIGPGTGLVTRPLLSSGAVVVGVEPNPSLAAFLHESLRDAELEVVVAPFEDALLPEGTFDLAVAATSFHWVDQHDGLHKLRRLLHPGGWVAIWWMLFEDPNTLDDFAAAAQTVLGVSPPIIEPGRPPFQIDETARCAGLRDAGFVNVQSELIRTEQDFDAGAVRALYATMAVVLRRPAHEQTCALDALEALVQRDFGGHVTRPFLTVMYTAQRPTSPKR
ncbi:MAG: class I SAM-dependent methyltransferase [Actinomycetota bacterium]|nr:class I SAM-dependent methyltransferase [Actinomycetota bacterium]